MTPEAKEIQTKSHAIFAGQASVGIAYLYGSRARGDTHGRSDYDFAVYLVESDPVKRGDIRAYLISELTEKLETDNVDVVVLNDLESPELKYNIIREGEVMFEREPYRVLIEPRILNEYFDFLYLLRKYNLTTV